MVRPVVRREMVMYLKRQHALSERRACRLVGCDRSTARYRPRRPAHTALREQLRTLAQHRPRFGYRRLAVLLRRAGHAINHKRVYRLYRLEGLAVRRRQRKRIAPTQRPVLNAPQRAGQAWAMDFTHDTFANGRHFRTLNIVDMYTRECLAIEVDTSLPSARVVRVLERISETHGFPDSIRVDNGPEFAGKLLDAWAYQRNVQLMFIQPGKPTQNGYVESFNGKFRDECLSQHWFLDLDDARTIIAAWQQDYNMVRPHSALGNQAPAVFAQAIKKGAPILAAVGG